MHGCVEAGGILLLGGGINPLMIVLIHYVGLNSNYLSTACYDILIREHRHHNTSPTRAHNLIISTINSYQFSFLQSLCSCGTVFNRACKNRACGHKLYLGQNISIL